MSPAMRALLLLLLVAIVSALCGCVNDGGAPVPRRFAYPRLEPYDSVYVDAGGSSGLRIEANAGALVKVPRDSGGTVWIDVDYPRYGAVLHLTLNHASGDRLMSMMANREERFGRDMDGMKVVVTTVDNEFAEIWIGRAYGTVLTPLNIMATDGSSFILSGALELKRIPSSAEEVSPAVDAVYADLLHLGRTLAPI